MSGSVVEIDTGTEQLLARIEGRVGVITLNRPEARNALSDQLTPALRAMIKQLGEDDAVGCLLITGTGKAFCAGGDIKGMGGKSKRASQSLQDATADLIERQRSLTGVLAGLRKPTIAAIPGPAVGAGLAIALACDLRIMADNTFISAGYVRVALSGDYGITWLLTRLAGTGRARQYMFTGERISAADALNAGLVNRVVTDDSLRENALAWAAQLAQGPATAYGFMKDNLDQAQEISYLTSLEVEAANLVRAARDPDHQEAVRAFIEKRDPVFN